MPAQKNAALLTEVGQVLLERIKAATDDYKQPSQILQLAEAYALVATNDPREPGRVVAR